MPITQREADLMQMQAQIKVNQIVEDWKRQFLWGRLQSILAGQPQGQLDTRVPQPAPQEEDEMAALPPEVIPRG